VLVAAFWGGHVQHPASIRALYEADKKHSACGLHSLAEVYAVMSALPVMPVIPPEQVMLFVNEIRERLTLILLDETEYMKAIQGCADRGLTSGRVYDALLLGSAAKSKAQAIYTWNVKHFQSISPELGNRIRTP